MSKQEGTPIVERFSNIPILGAISYNSPVILTFSIICFFILILDRITKGKASRLFFSVYKSSPTDLLTYPRLVGHIMGHSDVQHYVGNFMIILLVGPMLEYRYGSESILFMILITAIITGLIHIIFGQKSTSLKGASGIVFMLIILSSFTNLEDGQIPLTLIFVAMMYLGKEFFNEVGKKLGAIKNNVAHTTHIVGGLCGAVFGFAWTHIDTFITNILRQSM
jgi:membrane associated rhomboid family serine protease